MMINDSFTFLLLAFASVTCLGDDPSHDWPQWRGPLATGYAPAGNPPLEWSENQHIKWKETIEGKGHASPVIWGERLFLVTAIPLAKATTEARSVLPPVNQGRSHTRFRGRGGVQTPMEEHFFVTLCIQTATGATLWKREGGRETPHEGHHPTNSYASGSPVTDGEHVICFFGSRGLFCYDMQGNEIWRKDLGNMSTRAGFGEGASPVLHGNVLIVLWDNEEDSHVFAFDKRTGRQLWKRPRDERTGWTTPFVLTHDGVTQVVINATHRVRSYDLASGALIWECGGQTSNAIPSIVADSQRVYALSGFRGNMAMAISLGKKGDLTETDNILWQLTRGTPYVPSPLLCDGRLWFTQGNNAVITCLDPKTGAAHYIQERLKGPSGFYASPVAVGNRVYLAGRNGITSVIENSNTLKVLAVNKLEGNIDASPAISGDALYIRTHRHLYCISK
jgi:outer membrane protein assembly factor BamB